MGLQSRTAVGLLREFLLRANLSRSNPAASFRSRPLPPLGSAFSRLLLRSVLLTTSETPAIARQFERSLPNLTAGETSPATPRPGNFARPTQAGHPPALLVFAPEPSAPPPFL